MFSIIFSIVGILSTVSVLNGLAASKPPNELLVAHSKREPFVIKQQNGALAGLDISIIEHFAKKLNFTLKYFEINLSINEMFSGCRSSPQNNVKNIDIFIGALDENSSQNEQLVASRAYYHDALTWCVQVKQPIPNWKNFFYLCRDPIVYVLFTIMCTSVIFMGYFMQQYEDLQPKWNWFRLTFCGVAPCLGLVSEYYAKIIPNRIFFAISLFGATLSYTVTISFILLLIQFPFYENQITTIKEILNERFELIGNEFALQHLMKQNETYELERLQHFNVCDDLNECLLQLNGNSTLAVAASRELARSGRFRNQAYCFESPEIIHNYALKFMVRKDFTYLDDLNAFIATASASGLIERWLPGKRIKYKKIPQEYNLLTNDSFKATYLIWSITLVTVVLVLCCEIVIFKNIHSSNAPRFWRIAETIIDPYRHFLLQTKLIDGHPAF